MPSAALIFFPCLVLKTGDDGYILYPDGSGAIYEIPEKPSMGNILTKDIYTVMDSTLDAQLANEEQGKKNVMLPVFGIRNGDQSVFAIITEGQENMQVNLAPNGHMYTDLNRVYATVKYRKSYQYTTTNDIEVTNTEEEKRAGDVTLKYMFLSGEDATYSGMAQVYREWLIENGQLKQTIDKDDKIPFHIGFLATTTEQNLIAENEVVATKFSDMEQFFQRFREKGQTNFICSILGWQKGGYGIYPAHLPVSGGAGGENGIRSLAQLLNEMGSPLYLYDNFIDVNEYASSGDKKNAVYSIMNTPLTDSASERYAISQALAFDDIVKQIDKMSDFGAGLLFENYGNELYEDYNENSNLTRVQMREKMQEVLQYSNEHMPFTAVTGGNAYTLPYADFISELPISSSGHFLLDYDVPFYQMVVHGSIPYSSDLPGNMANSYNTEKLKWIEYGCVPYFLLTAEDAGRLENSYYNMVYSTGLDSWEDTISQMIEEYENGLSDLYAQKIVSHQYIDEDLRVVIYEDGTTVIINYGSGDREYEGQTVKGNDYVILAK